MEISISQAQARVPVTVVKFKGKLDLSTQTEFEGRVWESILKGGTRDMLLDLTDVPYVSSAGLRALNSTYKLLHPDQSSGQGSAQTKSPHLKLAGLAPRVKEIFTMGRFDSFLDIYETPEQALAAF